MIIAHVLCLSENDVTSLLAFETCIPAVEQAFASYSEGRSVVYPVVRELIGERGIFGIKSGHVAERGWLGLKAGGFWHGNREQGLAPHQSTILVFDPDTGVLRALVGANAITWLRTGAVGAIAAKYLAPERARRAAVIGCGMQGQIQTRALRWALADLDEVTCYDANPAMADTFSAALEDLDLRIVHAPSVERAVAGADVIVTTTPSWEPLVDAAWVGEDVHISAIGADTRGKQELDATLFRDARVVVDDWAQASTIGESQHAHSAGWLDHGDLYAELGEICSGAKPGRKGFVGRTIFDATGLALQDLVTAGLAMSLAEKQGIGTWIEL